MWTYEDLARLSPDEFEQLVADLWRAMGFNVRLTGGPGDQGVDIIAEMERGVRLTLYIQAKCYGSAKKVDVREIREYSSLLRRGKCDSVVVVCASGFTGPALAEARELGVRTIDGQDLVTLLNQYNVPLPVSRQVAPSLSSKTEESVHRVEEEESVLQLLREAKKATPDGLSLGEEAVMALVSLVLGGIGLGAVVAIGFKFDWPFIFSFALFVVGLGLGAQCLAARRTIMRFRSCMGLTVDEARSLVEANFRTVDEVAKSRSEWLAALLRCSQSRASEIVKLAAGYSGPPSAGTQGQELDAPLGAVPARDKAQCWLEYRRIVRNLPLFLGYYHAAQALISDEEPFAFVSAKTPTFGYVNVLVSDRRLLLFKGFGSEALIDELALENGVGVEIADKNPKYLDLTFLDPRSQDEPRHVIRVQKVPRSIGLLIAAFVRMPHCRRIEVVRLSQKSEKSEGTPTVDPERGAVSTDGGSS